MMRLPRAIRPIKIRTTTFAIWEGLGCCGMQTLDVTYYGSFPILILFPELEKVQMRMTAGFQLTRQSPRYEEYYLAFPRNKTAFEERLATDPSLATDRARRLEVYSQVQRYLADNSLVFPMYAQTSVMAVSNRFNYKAASDETIALWRATWKN